MSLFVVELRHSGGVNGFGRPNGDTVPVAVDELQRKIILVFFHILFFPIVVYEKTYTAV